jgi:hypothetical protein
MPKSHRSYPPAWPRTTIRIETPLAPDLVARDFAVPAGSTVGFEHHIRPRPGGRALGVRRGSGVAQVRAAGGRQR